MFICKCPKCGCTFESNSKGRYCTDCKREYMREYRQTEKGKEVEKCYRKSKNRKKVQERYRKSEKGKEVARRYNHKRRAKKANVEHESWTPSEIFKRDQGICHICGLPVYDYEDAPNELKPQYDHVWPIDKGGADTPRNVKLSHAHCNAVKKNRWLSEVDREACREHISNALEELAEELL